jgi:hypothetical protein
MWMLDAETQKPVRILQMYLTVQEAQQLRISLEALLVDPEAKDHEHVLGNGSDFSVSIMTDAKRNGLLGYTEPERRLLAKK